MEMIDGGIDGYLNDFAASADPVLRRMEARARELAFPIVGPQVGRLLLLLARTLEARRVLELGSGFGYSAFWFAHAVGAEGEVVLTEGSAERAAEAAGYMREAGLLDRTRIEVGDALEIAGRLDGPFDVVFNDVDKHQYPLAFDRARPLLRPGGLFISDNMLWQGKVLGAGADDASTRGVLELTRRLRAARDLDTVLLPVRDGVTVSRLKGA